MAGALSRREFGVLTGAGVVSLVLTPGCGLDAGRVANDGRLKARPIPRVRTMAGAPPSLGLGGARDAVLQLPANADRGPIPLLVLLHGAGGSGERFLTRFGQIPRDAGVAVAAPDSRAQTWDAILGGYGSDVEFLDRTLARVFERVEVDPGRIAIGGFSDGATYALSLGLINGDLFGKIVAFSPGFVVDGRTYGTPRIFVSHGVADNILPIDRCTRVIVPKLRAKGHDVIVREFNGGHELPEAIAREGILWAAAQLSGRP